MTIATVTEPVIGPEPTAGKPPWRRLLHRQAWAYLGRYLAPHRGVLIALALLGALQSASTLPTLFFVRFAFDRLIPSGAVTSLVLGGVALVGFRLLASGLALYARALSLKAAKGAVADLRRDLIAGLYALPGDYFGRNDAARTHTHIVQESERVDNLTSTLLSTVLPAVLICILLGAFLLHLSPWLTLLLTSLAPVVWAATSLGGRRVKQEVVAFQGAFEGFSRGVNFVLRQMELTRTRGFEDGEIARRGDDLQRLRTSGVRMAMSFAWHAQLQSAVTGAAGLLLLVGGGVAVANKAMSLGDLLAFYLAAGLLNGQFAKVTAAIPEALAGDASLMKLLALRSEAPDRAYEGRRRIDFNGRLELETVDFAYADRPVLRQVSLELAPGSSTAVIGPNGAGKTTLINLVLGFLAPTRGRVLADGVPYDALDLKALRRSIGVVMQRPTFFTGSIADNVAYGWPHTPRETIEAACRQACAHDFIARLPQGYDTLIGEGGALLSGGEAQRLAIARALVGRPRLLILDEPTNHLDAAAIGPIMQNLTSAPERPTLLIISHDPEVVRYADRVHRIEQGALFPVPTAPANLEVRHAG